MTNCFAAVLVIGLNGGAERANKGAADTVLAGVLDEYIKAARDFKIETHAEKEQRDFRQEWMHRLVQVATGAGASTDQQFALKEAASLAYESSDYLTAEAIALKLLDSDSSNNWKFYWYWQLGDIRRDRFMDSQDPKSAEKASDYYDSAIKSFEMLQGSREDRIANQFRFLNIVRSQVKLRTTGGSKAKAAGHKTPLAMMPDLALAYITRYQDDLELPENVTAGDLREEFLALKMTCALKEGDRKTAEDALQNLYLLGSPTRGSAYHALRFASTLYKANSKDYRLFLQDWADSKHRDAHTYQLLYMLARSYAASGKFEEAIPLYQQLYSDSDHTARLVKEDQQFAQNDNEGTYGNVIFSLGYCNYKMGNGLDARKYLKEFIRLFPRSSLVEHAKELLDRLEHVGESVLREQARAKSRRKIHVTKILGIGSACLLVASVIYKKFGDR